jgi:glycosyltransferase involved in cell wall biosynthesis
VGVSEQVAESFRSHPRWHAPVRVIENGVHLPRVAAHADGGKALRSNLCVPPGGVVLATVARLVPSKGHEVLLEALARIDLPSILSCWAGDGPLRRPLERRARELGLSERVHFVGTLADVGPLLAAADVFVLPSLREGLPLALLEALAMARPVITTDASGIGERINAAEAGVVLEPGDPVALADAIVRLAGCPGLRERMGRGAAALAEAHFSARRCASDYQDLYEELLADGSAMH